ncbi:helix-turn-helix transcriptional regulator [Piscinibacter sp.]|uniref:helix-turn-helix transcriptional regulator n=1 Tax=Piscinibacter sp. TaxID=1903157 RepID=UPI00355965A1
MKASRLLSILMLLQARGRMTAAALAQVMEVSERTILRDIDQLSASGVPLWGERGRQGGFQLRPGWSTSLTGMTEPEANALLLAGLPGPATELGLGGAAASARLKLVASLPAEWREQADRVGARLHIDPTDWYRSQDTPNHLREVADAVWHARRISVNYESWRGAALRELEPLGLVLKAGAWYMVARIVGQDDVRTYRLASVRHLKLGTRTFKRPREFNLARYWQESTLRFESELRPLQARMRVSPRGLKWLSNGRLQVVEVPGASTDSLARTDWREVLIRIESIDHGARQLLAFGAEVEVIEPPALRAQLLRQLGDTMALYQGSVASRVGRPAAANSPARRR